MESDVGAKGELSMVVTHKDAQPETVALIDPKPSPAVSLGQTIVLISVVAGLFALVWGVIALLDHHQYGILAGAILAVLATWAAVHYAPPPEAPKE